MEKAYSKSVYCPQCGGKLPYPVLNTPSTTHCPFCLDIIQAAVYPAIYKAPPASPERDEGTTTSESDACCYYHPGTRAVRVCDHCGRFLCSLCDIEFGEHHYCSACIESGTQKKRIDNLQREISLYDDQAIAIALLGTLIWPIGAVTGPVALFIALRYWRSERSLVRRTRIRFIVAILLALLSIGLSILFIMLTFIH